MGSGFSPMPFPGLGNKNWSYLNLHLTHMCVGTPCQHSSLMGLLPIKAQPHNAQKVLANTDRTHSITLKYLKPALWHQEIDTNTVPRNLKHLRSKTIILNQDPMKEDTNMIAANFEKILSLA